MATFTNFDMSDAFALHITPKKQSVQEDTAISPEVISQTSNSTETTPEKKEAGSIIVNQYDPNKKAKEPENFREATSSDWDPMFRKAVLEYIDYTDYATNNWIMSLNEAEQNNLLVSLTNKLYQMIVDKIDNIDYGEIPATKGDITKLSRYKELRKCLTVLRDIFKQYREDDEPIDTIENACDNIENMKDIFTAAFVVNSAFPISVYKTMTLAVVNATSFMIACCIEYIKNPRVEGLSIVLKKTGVARVKDHLVYETLKDFNDACRKGDVENALRPFIRNRARGFAMTAALGIKAALVIGGVALAVLPLIKDLVYFFYATKARLSTYFDIQGKLLEMNAQELKDNPDIKTDGDKKSVIARQLTIANAFYKLSNALAVDAKTAEVKATNDIKKDKGKYKIDDVDPVPGNNDGPLF